MFETSVSRASSSITSRTSVPGCEKSSSSAWRSYTVRASSAASTSQPISTPLAGSAAGPAVGVRRVDGLVARVVIGHLPVLVVGVHGALRAVDRQLLVVGADAVQMRVVVAEDARHQHPVRRQAGPRDEVGGVEARLLDLGEEVGRVAIEDHAAHLDERVVALGPDLREVERVEAVVGRLGERHHLHVEGPLRRVARGDRVVQVAAMVVAVLPGEARGLVAGEVPDPLVRS